jgi:pilus assembly protein Flp/PilA
MEPARTGENMARLNEAIRRFLADDNGPTTVEYAIMLALIIAVCVAAISVLGQNTSQVFQNPALNSAAGGSLGS